MYHKHLRQAGHSRRFEIHEADGVWEVRAAHDSRIVKHARYDDWHRVERTMLAFSLEVLALEAEGWTAAD
jgi:hypothetical protein